MAQHPFISEQVFDQCVEAYENHPDRFRTEDSNDIKTLKAVSFDVEYIQEILEQQDVKELSIFFIVKPDDRNGTNPFRQGISIAVAGLDSQGYLIADKILDYGRACPPYCPKRR